MDGEIEVILDQKPKTSGSFVDRSWSGYRYIALEILEGWWSEIDGEKKKNNCRARNNDDSGEQNEPRLALQQYRTKHDQQVTGKSISHRRMSILADTFLTHPI